MSRPPIEDIQTGAEFNRWYWLKVELVDLCKRMHLPSTGSKFLLRDRIMYALDHNGEVMPEAKNRTISKFNWAKEVLTRETLITDNVTFGQNFRRFMKGQVGEKFSFHTDFMDWVKNHQGSTLGDAVEHWYSLEEQKKDPDFRNEIADHNMYNQYTRDFLEDNPTLLPADARKYWLLKKGLPTEDGFVRYVPSDLDL
ncbi:MAG TPA: hypothetical protein DCE41_00660 [Cytophagales bacterium]|nr:hypothetical protein [Cytophagales bacterium]HAA23595.1 hypothetical protein [Cytophagales bacterium]HAP60733.1 hypothetical protein [Cytophagales bacterium]